MWRANLKLNYMLKKIRNWLFRKWFTEEEKYLMTRAIGDRIDTLERVAINEKWADHDNIGIDCDDYRKLKTIFITESWH